MYGIDTKSMYSSIGAEFIFFYKQLYGEVLYKIIDNIPLFLDKKALK